MWRRRWIHGTSVSRCVVGLVRRHSRLTLAAVLVMAALGVAGALIPHPESDDPTSSTSRAEWAISPSQPGGPTIRFQIDQMSGWTRVTDSRSAAHPFFAHEGRLLFEMAPDFASRTGQRYVSIPVDTLFADGVDFSPSQIAPSLDRDPKECTYSSEVEAEYVRFFLREQLGDRSQYFICGSAVFTAEEARVFGAEKWLSEVDHPLLTEGVRLEDLGDSAQHVLDKVRAQLRSRGSGG